MNEEDIMLAQRAHLDALAWAEDCSILLGKRPSEDDIASMSLRQLAHYLDQRDKVRGYVLISAEWEVIET